MEDMKEVVITLMNRTEMLMLDSIEREFLSSVDNFSAILIGLTRFFSFGRTVDISGRKHIFFPSLKFIKIYEIFLFFPLYICKYALN